MSSVTQDANIIVRAAARDLGTKIAPFAPPNQ